MKKVLTISLLSFIILAFNSVDIDIKKLLEKVELYFIDRPMEKAFIHYDKPYYAAGDQIWYSAYLLDYQTNTGSELSEILYVELRNNQNKPIITQRLELFDGRSHGLMHLPDTLSSGTYTLMAYSSYMQNFDPSLYFIQQFPIVSYTRKKGSVKVQPKEPQLQFYPEGGQLVENKLNRIAFTTDQDVVLQGFISSNEGNIYQQIKTDDSGAGIFDLVPITGKVYQINLLVDADTLTYELPPAKPEGVVLRVDNSKEKLIDITAQCSSEYNGQNAYIVVQQHGKILFTANSEFANGGLVTRIPKSALPAGLIQISLINQEGNLMNSRLISNGDITGQDLVKVSGKQRYAQREHVELKIETSELSTLSVGIIPLEYFGGFYKPNLASYFNVTAGTNIANEGLINNNSLENSLLTGEIKAYDWEAMMISNEPDFKYVLEKRELFNFQGTMSDSADVLKEGQLYSIVVTDEDGYDFYFDRLKKDQKFQFAIPSFDGEKQMVVKAAGLDEEQHNIDYQLDRNKISIDNNDETGEFEEKQYAYSRQVRENQTINRMYALKNYEKESVEEELNISFSVLKSADKVIKLEDYVPLPTMEEVASEILEGVKITKNSQGEYVIRMRNQDARTGYFTSYNKEQPLLFIDGLPIQNPDIIGNLNPLDVHTIEMTYGHFKLNDVKFQGVLSIRTVEGNYAKIAALDQGVFNVKGFLPKHQFAVPETNQYTPDFRTTLYWNANAEIGPDDPLILDFPTSDEPGKYRVEIQGITLSGKPFSTSYEIEVTNSLNN